MENEARLAIEEIGGKREEQGRITRVINRVVLSPTCKMAPAAKGQMKDS